jgi:hypothetical protein
MLHLSLLLALSYVLHLNLLFAVQYPKKRVLLLPRGRHALQVKT